MWLASLLTLVCVALTAYAARQYGLARSGVARTESLLRRLRAARAERERFVAWRQNWAEASQAAETGVGLGNTVTQVSHRTIAAIPFEILEAIPTTSATTKVVRGIHDDVAGNVYDAIGALNKGIGAALRASLTGNQPPPDKEPRKPQ